MAVVAGIDSSTQSCTVVLRDADDGEIVAVHASPHPRTTPPVSEQAPDRWWTALAAALADAGTASIAAVCVDAQAHGLVPLDSGGRVIRPAKLWNDTTSAAEARELVDRLGAPEWARRAGSVPVGAFTISKLLWLARHEPDSFRQLAHVLLPHDWLTYRLTGQLVTDPGDASGTGYYNPSEGTWRPDLLALVDPDVEWPSRLPRVLGPDEPAGAVTAAAAEQLGLTAGTPVGPGTADNQAAAVGMGVGTGDVVVSLGTSGVVFARSETPVIDPSGAVNGNADATGAFLPVVCTLNAAKVTDTFARLLGVDHAGLTQLALNAPADPDRPVLAAYLDGERVPDRPHASGTLSGLRSDTTREQIARAAYEGVLAGLLAGLRTMGELGVPIGGRLAITGGGARSAAYRQILADLSGRPVHVVEHTETAAAGAAVQAAAVLHQTTVADISRRWAPPWQVVAEPRRDSSARDLLLRRYDLVASWNALEDPALTRPNG
jgi:xylulokinase